MTDFKSLKDRFDGSDDDSVFEAFGIDSIDEDLCWECIHKDGCPARNHMASNRLGNGSVEYIANCRLFQEKG